MTRAVEVGAEDQRGEVDSLELRNFREVERRIGIAVLDEVGRELLAEEHLHLRLQPASGVSRVSNLSAECGQPSWSQWPGQVSLCWMRPRSHGCSRTTEASFPSSSGARARSSRGRAARSFRSRAQPPVRKSRAEVKEARQSFRFPLQEKGPRPMTRPCYQKAQNGVAYLTPSKVPSAPRSACRPSFVLLLRELGLLGLFRVDDVLGLHEGIGVRHLEREPQDLVGMLDRDDLRAPR